MTEKFTAAAAAFIIATISTMGYSGIILLMALESACIPIPSEVTMPFAGYLVATARFGLQEVAVTGAVGCLLGSYAAYYAGLYGGRPFLDRYGRYALIAPHDLEIADRFFVRWGNAAVFAARLLPVVRTFIALPAGIARMPLLPFSVYTLIGSYLWCLGLAYLGMTLGDHWTVLEPYFHRLSGFIGAAGLAGAAVFLYPRLRALLSPVRNEKAMR